MAIGAMSSFVQLQGGDAGAGRHIALAAHDTSAQLPLDTVPGPRHEVRGLQVAGGLALGGIGVAAMAGGGKIGALAGARGIGTVVGIAIGVAALAGAALLINRGTANASSEYLVQFRAAPELTGVPPGDVYATLRAHHERYAPAVEQELASLMVEEKVRSYSGIIGSNGFVVDVVNRHRGEVEQRLAAIDDIGDVTPVELR